jgi:hypothetical protein
MAALSSAPRDGIQHARLPQGTLPASAGASLGQRLDTADLAVASEAGLQQMKQLDRRVRHPGDTLVSE